MKRIGVLAILLSSLAFLLSALAFPPVALAHAFVIGSDPVDGSTINAVPPMIRIFFNAPISPLSVAHVYNTQNGGFVEVQTLRSSISQSNPRELDTVLLHPDTLTQGGYFVRWVAVANDDGHTTFGAIGFNVGYSSTGLSGTPTLGPTTSNALTEIRTFDFISVLAVAWEWLSLMALLFWIGLLFVERVLLAPIGRDTPLIDRTRKHSISLQWLCLCAFLVGDLVTLLLRVLRLTDITQNGTIDLVPLGQLLLQTTYGHTWLIRIALLAGAFFLLWWTQQPQRLALSSVSALSATRTQRTKTTPDGEMQTQQAGTKEAKEITETTGGFRSEQSITVFWFIIAGLLLLTLAITGNNTALVPHTSAILFTWLLLVAAALWFGSLAYLGYVVLPVAQREQSTETLAIIVRRARPWLLGSIGILLASGFFLSEAAMNDSNLFFTDSYGRTLFVTILLVLTLCGFSLYMLLVLCPRFTRQTMLLPVVDAELPARRTRQSALTHLEYRLKQVLNIHALLAAGILLCVALLSFYAPPIAFPAISYSNPVLANATGNAQTKQVGDLSITLQVLPGKPTTANTVIVFITDATGKGITNATLHLSTNMQIMDMGTASATLSESNAVYSTTLSRGKAFSMAGLWNINLSIQRPGQTAVQTTWKVMVTD